MPKNSAAASSNDTVQTASQLSLARHSPSPVPTELDVDNAERSDIDAYLYNAHKIAVVDYAYCPPAQDFSASPSSSTDPALPTSSFALTSTSIPSPAMQKTQIPEAFFAKDAISQYEWFMARGSNEWDNSSEHGTEVWEDNEEEQDEKTRAEENIEQSQSLQASTQSQEQTQTTILPSNRCGQPLRRQECLPFTGTGTKLPPEALQTPQAVNTPPCSPVLPEETQKTPLLPSFSPQSPVAPRTITPKRTAPIPGRTLYRLREIRWVTDEEAGRRWLPVDWDEYWGYERKEREKCRGDEGAGGEDCDWWMGRGYKGQGQVGYPYWVVWGSPPVVKKEEKEKEKEVEKKKEDPRPATGRQTRTEGHEHTLAKQVEVAEEDDPESQSTHATLCEALQSPEAASVFVPISVPSPLPSGDDLRSMQHTLNTIIETSGNSPPPLPDPSTFRLSTPGNPTSSLFPTNANPTASSVLPNSSPPEQAAPKRSIPASLAAQLYYLALDEDAHLGYGKGPSREYRRALGEKAGDVWIWLREYLRKWETKGAAGLEVATGKEDSQALFEGVGEGGNVIGSGRVLDVNERSLGTGLTGTPSGGIGGDGELGKTATLRGFGGVRTSSPAALMQQQQRTESLKQSKPPITEEVVKMDVDPPAPATATTPPNIAPKAKDDSMDADFGIDPEATPQLVADPSNARKTTRWTQTPASMGGQGRLTRSAAQRQRSDQPVDPTPKKRTRAATTKDAGEKSNKRAVEPEPKVGASDATSVAVGSGGKTIVSKRNKKGMGKERTIHLVDSETSTPDSGAMVEWSGAQLEGKKRAKGLGGRIRTG
ncbi:hypothetical protein V5O48_012695 [Marasmius crinis-equi]|uniref:Uncharacterized protein n=1 Tax=Marasmius crinis-equi TaxID=585013 RepID=A0ABR3F240_9AGAR